MFHILCQLVPGEELLAGPLAPNSFNGKENAQPGPLFSRRELQAVHTSAWDDEGEGGLVKQIKIQLNKAILFVGGRDQELHLAFLKGAIHLVQLLLWEAKVQQQTHKALCRPDLFTPSLFAGAYRLAITQEFQSVHLT